jgi:hypothetical protein
VVKGEDVARGDKLTINVSTHEAQMQSNVTGAGKPGRVRAVVYPDKTNGTDKSSGPDKTGAPGKTGGSDKTSGPDKTSEGVSAAKP